MLVIVIQMCQLNMKFLFELLNLQHFLTLLLMLLWLLTLWYSLFFPCLLQMLQYLCGLFVVCVFLAWFYYCGDFDCQGTTMLCRHFLKGFEKSMVALIWNGCTPFPLMMQSKVFLHSHKLGAFSMHSCHSLSLKFYFHVAPKFSSMLVFFLKRYTIIMVNCREHTKFCADWQFFRLLDS